MLQRSTRVRIWRLLLPMPIAAGMVAAAGYVARTWYTSPIPTTGQHARTQAPAVTRPPLALIPSESLTTPSSPSQEQAQAHPPTAQPAPPRAAVQAAPQARTQTALRPQSRASLRYSFEPAPEPIAPSYEVARRPIEPPPTVARTPRLAPVPIVPMLPAPEPSTSPRVAPMETVEPSRASRPAQQVRAVRFDAGYYYGQGTSAKGLAEELAASWSKQGVNLVYYYAYNRVYGARYRTHYAGNVMEDYGKQDLLRYMLRECHQRNIQVVAWIQGVQHKQMWEQHPDWRQKTVDGKDYKPDNDSYYLCVRNPEVQQWWLGMVDEMLQSYPELDGLDLAEFQLDLWGDHACHCEHCRSQFAQAHPGKKPASDEWRKFRADGLTRTLLATSRLAHRAGKDVHLTTVFTARNDGKLMTSAQVRDAIGFDLDAILASPDRPEVVQAELIWQQWAALYSARDTFTPEWTTGAVKQAKAMLHGRAKLIAHVEVTDFGVGALDGPKLARTIASAAQGGPLGIDIYDAHLLAQTEGASKYLQLAWLGSGT
jgi:hypothetical protein